MKDKINAELSTSKNRRLELLKDHQNVDTTIVRVSESMPVDS